MTWTAIDHTAVDHLEVSRAAFGYPVVDDLNDLNTRVTSNTSTLTTKANTSTTVSAGTGLTGGGDLSANRTLTVAYGTAAGTATQGNDTRVVNAVQTSRQVIAGTGLTGGGDFSADRTMAVSFGNTATTVAAGSRVTALEAGPLALGSWKAANSTQNIAYATGSSDNLLVFGTAVTPAVGMSINGTFDTVTIGAGMGGWYTISAQFDVNASNATTHLVNLSIRDGANTTTLGSCSSYFPSSAFTTGSATANVFLNAGDSFQVRLGIFTGTGSGNYTNTSVGTGRTFLRATRQ